MCERSTSKTDTTHPLNEQQSPPMTPELNSGGLSASRLVLLVESSPLEGGMRRSLSFVVLCVTAAVVVVSLLVSQQWRAVAAPG